MDRLFDGYLRLRQPIRAARVGSGTCGLLLNAPGLRPTSAARMTLPQIFSFGIIAATMALFVWGRLRYDLVALLALLAAIATGIVPADKAFSGFSDDIVIIVACALLVSAAVGRSGVIEDALVRIGPYLTTAHHPGRRAGRHRDGALGLREEHRRARHADAGRVLSSRARPTARRRST